MSPSLREEGEATRLTTHEGIAVQMNRSERYKRKVSLDSVDENMRREKERGKRWGDDDHDTLGNNEMVRARSKTLGPELRFSKLVIRSRRAREEGAETCSHITYHHNLCLLSK